MRVLAVMVTYFPGEGLPDRVERVRTQVDRLLVVDNGSHDSEVLRHLADHLPAGVELIRLGENLGIAHALNVAVRRAIEQSYQALLTLDQDSDLPPDYVERLTRFARQQAERPRVARLGGVAPNFRDVNAGTQASFFRLEGWRPRRLRCGEGQELLEVDMTITSGTLYLTQALQAVGPFNDRLFIDYVDAEYGLRLRSHGYSLLVHCPLCIDHRLGQRQVRRWLGLTLKPLQHPPARRYYMARNLVYLSLRYGWRYPAFAVLAFMLLAHDALSIVGFEDQKAAKLGAVLRGLWHGAWGRLGRL